MERQSSHFIFCLMFFIKICTDFETLPLKSLFAGFTAHEWDLRVEFDNGNGHLSFI